MLIVSLLTGFVLQAPCSRPAYRIEGFVAGEMAEGPGNDEAAPPKLPCGMEKATAPSEDNWRLLVEIAEWYSAAQGQECMYDERGIGLIGFLYH